MSFWQIQHEMSRAVTSLHMADAALKRITGVHPEDRTKVRHELSKLRMQIEACMDRVHEIEVAWDKVQSGQKA
jgi:hypothetical protein